MSDSTRRFFGLLCAHKWEDWGELQQTYISGRTRTHIVLKCQHCGEIKYPRKPK